MEEFAKQLTRLEQDIVEYKTTQMTQGDSTNYYCVAYNPGWYILDENHYREHTIECVPVNNEKNAIFMADMRFTNSWWVSGSSATGRALCYKQNIITWLQDGQSSSKMSNATYAAGVPKGFMIFSNVDFFIKTSYVDKSV